MMLPLGGSYWRDTAGTGVEWIFSIGIVPGKLGVYANAWWVCCKDDSISFRETMPPSMKIWSKFISGSNLLFISLTERKFFTFCIGMSNKWHKISVNFLNLILSYYNYNCYSVFGGLSGIKPPFGSSFFWGIEMGPSSSLISSVTLEIL